VRNIFVRSKFQFFTLLFLYFSYNRKFSKALGGTKLVVSYAAALTEIVVAVVLYLMGYKNIKNYLHFTGHLPSNAKETQCYVMSGIGNGSKPSPVSI
jgi:ABC-type multidrug transport system permease subunit